MADTHHHDDHPHKGDRDAAGHQMHSDDMNLSKIALVGVASLALFAVGIVWAYFIMKGREAEIHAATGVAARPALVGRDEIGIVDQLQFARDKRLEVWQAEKKKALSSWGWVNRPAGIAHIPIEKAMEWVVLDPPNIPGEGVPPLAGTPAPPAATSLPAPAPAPGGKHPGGKR